MKRPSIIVTLILASALVLASAMWFVFLGPPDTQPASVEASPEEIPAADLLQRSGKLSLLRVHDVGTGFGPPTDFIDVEVVVRLANQPGGFGFRLRDDSNRPARQGMLDLLRDAFNNNWTVTFDYEIEPPKEQGVIIRVSLIK